ncbi:MAG: DNA recombination protein RmuC [candidate division WOR-3 bacterium]
MNEILLTVIIGAVIILLLLGLFLNLKSEMRQEITNLNQRVDNFILQFGQISESISGNVNQKMDSLIIQLNQITESTNRRVDNLNNILTELTKSIGQEFRGRFGEIMLERLIEDLLPKSYYEFQFQLGNGVKVDAVIKFPNPNKVLPIDSKFPLSNYEKMLSSENDKDRKKYRDEFVRDVKKRCEEISDRYIQPHNGTFDFAFMFIPSESIYYEIISGDDGEETLRYMLDRKVIPTSPTTLYFHLLMFMNHFRIWEIQRNVGKIIDMLSGLENEFKNLQSEFETLGGHLNRAQSKYAQLNDKFQRFNLLIENLTRNELLNP